MQNLLDPEAAIRADYATWLELDRNPVAAANLACDYEITPVANDIRLDRRLELDDIDLEALRAELARDPGVCLANDGAPHSLSANGTCADCGCSFERGEVF